MRVLCFLAALLLASVAEASDDVKWSEKEIAEIEQCVDVVEGRLALLSGNDKHTDIARRLLGFTLNNLKTRDKYLTWRGCEDQLRLGEKSFLIATGQKEAPPLTD